MRDNVPQEIYIDVSADLAINIADNMSEVFQAGYIALVSRSNCIKNGEYAAAKWPGGEYSIVKAFDVDGMRVYVSICEDSYFAPVLADNMPYEIVGKVTGVQFPKN